ncbi:uncharacterized protein [Temnothorax nylanderi]|uniref:uncharacterized protein n=1 Tax=Temnothorax nylanderi TaxID=102681 RepID=UPI003A85AB82
MGPQEVSPPLSEDFRETAFAAEEECGGKENYVKEGLWSSNVELHVIRESSLPIDVVIGRDILRKHELSVQYSPSKEEQQEVFKLFGPRDAVCSTNIESKVAPVSDDGYKSKVAHSAGKQKIHVDALSRHDGLVEALPLERELEFKQLRDHRSKEIAEKLEFEDNDKLELIDGLVPGIAMESSHLITGVGVIKDGTNLKHVYNDHVNTDMSYEDFFVVDASIEQRSRNMDSSEEIRERERIANQIAKTSDSIRKKYHALKTGKMEEDIALERHFKPIIEPLNQIAENTVGKESDVSKIENETVWEDEEPKLKRKRPNISFNDSVIASIPVTLKRSITVPSNLSEITKILQPRKSKRSKGPSNEDVFETTDDSLVTSVRQQLQTSEGRETLRDHLGPFSQKYVGAVLSGDQESGIDTVYGVYFSNDGMMLGNKRFDVDNADNIIIDGIRYAGTRGLYELIFKKIPNDEIYTKDDMQKYKSILLMTNAHKRNHDAHARLNGNRGYKYRNIIAPLISGKKAGKGIPRAMTLNGNKIDYVHWDDPNELVDRLRLLEASRLAGHNGHDNEILSIIKELREAGLIIN